MPKVTGWIGVGILLRALQLPGLTEGPPLDRFLPFMHFVLGYIMFTVGAALHFKSLRNTRLRLGILMLGELLVTPAVVFVALFFVARQSVTVSLLLAAIAIAGAPGTTVLVAHETRARGTLTRTLIAAVALIDMVSVGLFVFVASLIGSGGGSFGAAMAAVGIQFGVTFLVGGLAAVLALGLTRTIVGPAFVGPMFVFVILFAWGLASGIGTSGILACTFAGIAVSNMQHDTVRAAEAYLKQIGTVLFAAFFTFAGMRLDFSQVVPLLGLVTLLCLSRFAGKYLGAWASLFLAGVPAKLRNNFGLALVPQGGVAVGLILLVQEQLGASPEAVQVVTTLGLAGIAINQLIGPSAVRVAIQRAGEAGKDRARLLDFLDENHITVDVRGDSREEIIRNLTDKLYATSSLSLPQNEFLEEVLRREKRESTCLGQGLMIPHTILKDDDEITGVLGISSAGLDLGAPDGRPIHAVLLLATPENERTRHLEILAAFASAITSDLNLREQLYHARSPAHAYNVLHADEAEDMNYFLEDAIERAGLSV